MSEPASPDHAMRFGGVYEAIAERLLIGPVSHADTFIRSPSGSKFAEAELPANSSRYLISCLLPTSMVPAAASQKSSNSPDASVTTTTTTNVDQSPENLEEATAAVAQLRSNAAQFIAQMNARRKQQQNALTAVTGSTQTTGMPAVFARSYEKAMSRKNGGNARATGPSEATLRQLAEENELIRRAAVDVLGVDNFFQCAMTRDSLEEMHDVQEAVDFIEKILGRDPRAMIYVFSASGRNRASALAMYYLQHREHLALRDITRLLPVSTPQISFLEAFMAFEEQRPKTADDKAAFDKDYYLYEYFIRRYPRKSPSVIRVAVDTCPADPAGVDRLLHDEQVFTSNNSPPPTSRVAVDGLPLSLSASRSGTAPLTGASFGAGTGTAADGNVNSSRGLAQPSGELGSLTLSFTANASFNSEANWAAMDAANPGPIELTSLDADIINSICKALLAAKQPASYDDVQESYIRNRRRRQRVLREFLTRDGVKAARQADGKLQSPGASQKPTEFELPALGPTDSGQDEGVSPEPRHPREGEVPS